MINYKPTIGYHTTIESEAIQAADRSLGVRLLVGLVAWPIAGISGALAIWMSNLGLRMRTFGPLSMLNFLNAAAHANILNKDGRSLELLPKIDAVVFDKTGTLTLEQPHVAAIHASDGYDEHEVLSFAASAEYKQSHPIAKAIVEHAQSRQFPLRAPDDTHYELGLGISTQIDGSAVLVGSLRFMENEQIEIPHPIRDAQDSANVQGNSLVYVALDRQLVGAIELRSTLRPEVRAIVAELHARDITTYIISGDHEAPTRSQAGAWSWKDWIAENRKGLDPEFWTAPKVERTADGREFRSRFRLADLNPLEQTMVQQMRMELWRDGERVAQEEHTLTNNIYFKHELLLLLKAAGFVHLTVTGDFREEEANPDHGVLVFAAQKPA